jgi:hypothetical protein
LGVYLLLKKKFNSFFFKLVFFKIIFLRGQKVLILANIYKMQRRLGVSGRKGLGSLEKPKKSFRARKTKKKKTFKHFLLAKRFPWKSVAADKQKGRIFKKSGFALCFVNYRVERYLERLLLFPVEIKLKNVFGLKKKRVSSIRVESLCRLIYKKSKTFWKLKKFLFLKDSISILSLSFFYQKSGLLADYVSEMVKGRRKFLFELRNLKGLLPVFKRYYFSVYGTSVKVNVLGKIFGQRKRRFRCFSLYEGLKFSTQDVKGNVSYSLTQT